MKIIGLRLAITPNPILIQKL